MQKIKRFISDLYEYRPFPKGYELISMYFLIFFAGCVTGWIYEEIFYFVVEHKTLNSGFFYGPYLPVYGFGVLLILICVQRVKKHPLLVFFGSMVVTGVLEYVTGKVMYAIWHARWWDYRGLFLNIEGFVCLRSVLTFAVGGLTAVYVMEPFIRRFCVDRPKHKKYIALVFFCIMLTDVILTFLFREHTPQI